jgi:hypothetical protein
LEREKKRERKDGEMDERILGFVGSPRTPASQAAFGSQTAFGSQSTFGSLTTPKYSNSPRFYEVETQLLIEGRDSRPV